MRIFLLWLTFGFAMAASLPAYAQSAPKRVALVIGNSDYKSPTPKLPNPINDARLMAATLSGLGFDVDVRIDLSRDKMDEAFRAHRDRLLAGGPDAQLSYPGQLHGAVSPGCARRAAAWYGHFLYARGWQCGEYCHH